MSARITDAVNDSGFAIIRNHLPKDSSLAAFSQIGTVLRLPRVADVQVLAPRSEVESYPNTYSGNYGWSEFPLHTDLAHWYVPPRFFALRCVTGVGEVATHLLDGNALLAVIGETALRRALVQPRRPVERNRPLLRLLESHAGIATRFRWDRLFVSPATAASATTCDAVSEYLAAAKPAEVVLLSPGDTLIVDNWRMLHGRSAVPTTARARRIERAYFGALN